MSSIKQVTVTVSGDAPAAGTFTDWLQVDAKQEFDISIQLSSGVFACDVYLQRSFDGGTTAKDAKLYDTDADIEEVGRNATSCLVRLGVKDTGWTSGTIILLLRAMEMPG